MIVTFCGHMDVSYDELCSDTFMDILVNLAEKTKPLNFIAAGTEDSTDSDLVITCVISSMGGTFKLSNMQDAVKSRLFSRNKIILNNVRILLSFVNFMV